VIAYLKITSRINDSTPKALYDNVTVPIAPDMTGKKAKDRMVSTTIAHANLLQYNMPNI
jgi:hypothetical protein